MQRSPRQRHSTSTDEQHASMHQEELIRDSAQSHMDEPHQRPHTSCDTDSVPAWVTRLSRPSSSASPRVDSPYCLPYDAKVLTRPASSRASSSPYVVSRPKGSQLNSTQIAFPPDFPGLSVRPARSTHSSCRSTPRQSHPAPGWVERLSNPSKFPACKDPAPRPAGRKPLSHAAPCRPSTAPNCTTSQPALAPSQQQQQQQQQLQQQHHKSRSCTNPAAWNLDAIRQQLARLQAANCSCSQNRCQQQQQSPSPGSPKKDFRISAHPGK